jgi:hypothetical protein
MCQHMPSCGVRFTLGTRRQIRLWPPRGGDLASMGWETDELLCTAALYLVGKEAVREPDAVVLAPV